MPRDATEVVVKSMVVEYTAADRRLLGELREVGVRVGVVVQEPWAYDCGLEVANSMDWSAKTSYSDQKCLYPGIGIEMIHNLCQVLLVSCQFIRLNYTDMKRSYAPDLEDHQLDFQEWLKGEIVGGDIDTTLPNVVRTESNLDRQLLDFTLPLFYMDGAERILGIIIRKQMAGPSRVMFKPFTPMVWGLLGLLLLFTVAYDVFCSKILANTHRMRKLQNSCPPAAVGDPFMTHFGVLTQRSVNVNAADWSRRILYATLGVGSISICGSYSAFLVGQRITSQIELPFKNLDQLADVLIDGSYRFMVDQHSTHIFTNIENSQTPAMVRLKAAFKKAENKPIVVTNMTEAVSVVGRSQEPLALYSSQFVLRAASMGNCNVTIVPLKELNERGSLAFRKKNYEFSELFKKVALSFKEKGDFYDKSEVKYRFSQPCAPNYGLADSVGVAVESLQELFYFVLGGLLLGFCILLLELMYRGAENIYSKPNETLAMATVGFMLHSTQINNHFYTNSNAGMHGSHSKGVHFYNVRNSSRQPCSCLGQANQPLKPFQVFDFRHRRRSGSM